MRYRPLTDVIIPARPKLAGGRKYYGAYPAGYLERARALLGCHIDDPVLHVCSGLVRHYPYPDYAIGPNDRTLDLDPKCEPDFLQDAREPYPEGFAGILADPPYNSEHATRYRVGADVLPSAGVILRNALKALAPGRRVGMLHFVSPRPPRGTRLVGVFPVWMGYDMQIRVCTVYERGRVLP